MRKRSASLTRMGCTSSWSATPSPQAWRTALADLGYNVTPVYFRSIHYRKPGGVLFEIATDRLDMRSTSRSSNWARR